MLGPAPGHASSSTPVKLMQLRSPLELPDLWSAPSSAVRSMLSDDFAVPLRFLRSRFPGREVEGRDGRASSRAFPWMLNPAFGASEAIARAMLHEIFDVVEFHNLQDRLIWQDLIRKGKEAKLFCIILYHIHMCKWTPREVMRSYILRHISLLPSLHLPSSHLISSSSDPIQPGDVPKRSF